MKLTALLGIYNIPTDQQADMKGHRVNKRDERDESDFIYFFESCGVTSLLLTFRLSEDL